MKKCGTCKHFGEIVQISYWPDDADDEIENIRLHVCGLLKHLNENTESKKAAMTAPAGVVDGSGYHAVFCVSEDFGCNQWQSHKSGDEQ